MIDWAGRLKWGRLSLWAHDFLVTQRQYHPRDDHGG
jgi:hypothetical protein